MSNNPLRDLLALMDEMEGGESWIYSRQLKDAEGSDSHIPYFDRMQRLLLEVREIFDREELWEDFGEIYKHLHEEIVRPGDNWMVQGTGMSGVTGIHRTAINAAIRIIDQGDSLPNVLSVEQLEGLRVTLEKLRKQIGAISEIPDNLRNHLDYLIARGLDIIDGENIDLTALRSLSFEIAGASLGAVVQASKEEGKVLFERLGEILNPWLMNVSSGAVAGFISAIATSQVVGP